MRLATLFFASASAAIGLAGAAFAAPDVAKVLDGARAANAGGHWDRRGEITLTYAYKGQGLVGVATSRFDAHSGAFVDSQNLGIVSGANGFDGKAAWMQDLSGAVTPQAGGDTVELSVNEAYRDANLWWRPDFGGARIEGVRTETVGDVSYDVLRVTPVGGKPFDAWFDAKTHLLARTIEIQGPQTITTFYNNYRDVDGLQMATAVTIDDGSGEQFHQTLALTAADFTRRRPASAYGPPAVKLTDGAIAGLTGRTTVPFQLLNNHVYVPVTVNGKGPFQFILDTGGHDILTPDTAKALGIRTEGDAPGTGAGEGVVDTDFAKGVTLQVGDLTLSNQTVAVLPITSKAAEGFDEPGMLGFEVLRRFVTVIDYGAGTVTFIDPAKFTPIDQGAPVPFVFYSHLPQVTGAFEGVPGRFDIDTGSRDELTLTKPFAVASGLVAKHPKGVEAVDGWGVGGPARSYVTRSDDLTLGTVHLDHFVVGFGTQDRGAFADASYQGNVGTAMLKRFVATFDYGHQVIYLKPLAKPPADIGVFDKAGFWINLADAGFKIVDLTKGGPAAAAGLKLGDEITAVDGTPAGKIGLSDLRRRFRDDAAGTVVKLNVLSKGVKRTVALTLKDQI
jgi:hypothetical protein